MFWQLYVHTFTCTCTFICTHICEGENVHLEKIQLKKSDKFTDLTICISHLKFRRRTDPCSDYAEESASTHQHHHLKQHMTA